MTGTDKRLSMSPLKFLTLCVLGLAILAAPCVLDVSSQEPSPLAGLLAATSQAATPQLAK